ncbi:hypothetical protein PI125_g21665 [Phytophthora idaei]|nr:hypothetical protein PI125_g21665 [Phytophthora idaei]
MDAGRAPASGLDGSNRYADTLKRYRLYDCSGVIRPLSDGEMRSWFERWRGTRGKRVTVARTVTQNYLNQAWASFADCWSEETGAAFRETIMARGTTHARMSRLDQMARRLEQLEQDNHELRRRVRHREESRDVQPQHERWQHQRRWR